MLWFIFGYVIGVVTCIIFTSGLNPKKLDEMHNNVKDRMDSYVDTLNSKEDNNDENFG